MCYKAGNERALLVVGGVGVVSVLILRAVARNAGGKFSVAWDNWRSEVVKKIAPDARFASKEYINRHEFDETGLNTDSYNSFSGGDMLQVGTGRCCRLAVQRIETRYRTVTYTDAQGRTQSKTESYTEVINVYNGLILAAPAMLAHPGRVVISNAGLPRNWQLKPLRIAHPGLTKTYAVGSSPTEFEGHRLLTPSLQTMLWSFREGFRTAPRVSYVQKFRGVIGQMWIAIPNVSLEMGKRPSLFSSIAGTELRNVVQQCTQSIDWVKRAITALQPQNVSVP